MRCYLKRGVHCLIAVLLMLGKRLQWVAGRWLNESLAAKHCADNFWYIILYLFLLLGRIFCQRALCCLLTVPIFDSNHTEVILFIWVASKLIWLSSTVGSISFEAWTAQFGIAFGGSKGIILRAWSFLWMTLRCLIRILK